MSWYANDLQLVVSLLGSLVFWKIYKIMKIGIDASRAFRKQKTGIEEYAFQVIANLRNQLIEQEVVLYVKKNDFDDACFELPQNWTVKAIPYNYFWTQIGLSWELLINPVNVLFVPAHTIPFVHPQNSFVTVHGLEYEHCPESYSGYSRWFHRIFVKMSCWWAKKVIAVSKNTKKDLCELYKVSEKKIEVVYNGVDKELKKRASSTEEGRPLKFFRSEFGCFILFVGRLEKRKNIVGIVKAFEVLKKKFGYQGKLLLAGKPGYGISEIERVIRKSEYQNDIIELGFVSNQEREMLLHEADVFWFPSLCEGFGIPVLEAQSVGTPVITSRMGPLDEVAGNLDILVDPNDYEGIARLASRMISDENFRSEVSKKGLKNVLRFSWKKSAQGVAEILVGSSG
jgi:glycosyltransferase involved in cell wall biosynthesis